MSLIKVLKAENTRVDSIPPASPPLLVDIDWVCQTDHRFHGLVGLTFRLFCHSTLSPILLYFLLFNATRPVGVDS